MDDKTLYHVANLAKLKIEDKDKIKYKESLSQIMTSINKILELDIDNDEVMISPTTNTNKYSSDEVGEMLTSKEIFKNVNEESDSYVVVLKVMND